MRTSTLFRAYTKAVDEMEKSAYNRNDWASILIASDYYALRYQRYLALSRKLEKRILDRLADEPLSCPPIARDLRKFISTELGTLGLLVIPGHRPGKAEQRRASYDRLCQLWVQFCAALGRDAQPPF